MKCLYPYLIQMPDGSSMSMVCGRCVYCKKALKKIQKKLRKRMVHKDVVQ